MTTTIRRSRKVESINYGLFASLIAGSTESALTYPLEYVKTRLQFSPSSQIASKSTNIIEIIQSAYGQNGSLRRFYNGVGAVVVGSLTKSIVRFGSYDYFKSNLTDSEGKLTGPRALIAGIGTGIIESLLVVTPFETIKTKLIDDSRKTIAEGGRKYKGSWINGTASIIREEGIGGIYKGLFPTMIRQATGSGIRFTAYSTLKSFVAGNSRPNETLPTGITFGLGAVSGLVTVLATQPLDVIKTRMQSLTAKTQYRNSFHCSARIFSEEGFLTYWKGIGPRSARVVISGGILFVVYEKVIQLLGARSP